MTELEMIRRAARYMKQLSQGIDPISGQEIGENSVLDEVRLARCFAFTADVLDRLAAQGGFGAPRARASSHARTPFCIPQGIDLSVLASEEPVQITRMTQAIRDLCYPDGNGPKLNPVRITNWLVENGLLESREDERGQRNRVPTAKGMALGITARPVEGANGSYMQVRYGTQAQQVILEHLPAILDMQKTEAE